MLNYMLALKDDRVVPFLTEEAKGPHLYARVNAMEGLLQRGQDEAVALLVAEWMELDPGKVDRYESDGPERLQAALARCGNEKAIAALAANGKRFRWIGGIAAWRPCGRGQGFCQKAVFANCQ